MHPPHYLLILRNVGGERPLPARRLARILKGLLRTYGMRCERAEDVDAEDVPLIAAHAAGLARKIKREREAVTP